MTVATITPTTCDSPDSSVLPEPAVGSGTGAGLTVNDRDSVHVRDHGAAGGSPYSPSWGDRHGGYFYGGSPAAVRDGQRSRRGRGRNRVVVVRNGCFTWTRGDEEGVRDLRDVDGGEKEKREGESEESSKAADSAEGLTSPVEWILSDLNFTVYSVRFSVDQNQNLWEKACELQP